MKLDNLFKQLPVGEKEGITLEYHGDGEKPWSITYSYDWIIQRFFTGNSAEEVIKKLLDSTKEMRKHKKQLNEKGEKVDDCWYLDDEAAAKIPKHDWNKPIPVSKESKKMKFYNLSPNETNPS